VFATGRTSRHGKQAGRFLFPGHTLLCSAGMGFAAPRVYCHALSLYDKASEIRGDLPVAHTTFYWVGLDWMSKQRIHRKMASDTIVNHTDFNSGLITATRSLFHYYANRNSCLICRPGCPTMAPSTHNANPDVLDIIIIRDFVLPVHLTVCSPLSSNHLPTLIHITWLSYFKNLLDGPEFPRIDSRLALKKDYWGWSAW
jgi:hypothetical protein